MMERHDKCDPHKPLWISWSNYIPSSLEMHLIIMQLAPYWYSTPSIRWYILDLHMMHSTTALSYDGGWLSKYALIELIQSYAGCCTGSSMIIRPAIVASLIDSSSLTKGLDNFLTITSDRVGALQEAIHARWSASWLSIHGAYQTSKPSKTSPSCTLLLDTWPSSHCCNHTLFAPALLPAANLPW
jgi:hypothetical protein